MSTSMTMMRVMSVMIVIIKSCSITNREDHDADGDNVMMKIIENDDIMVKIITDGDDHNESDIIEVFMIIMMLVVSVMMQRNESSP